MKLTKEIAKQFLEDPENVGIWDCTSIDDEAAVILSGYKGDLYLESLTKLSNEAARALSNHQGRLDLDNCVLSTKSAKYLSNHQHLFVSDEMQIIVDGMAEFSAEELAGKIADFLFAKGIIGTKSDGIEGGLREHDFNLSKSRDNRNVCFNTECIYEEDDYRVLVQLYGDALEKKGGITIINCRFYEEEKYVALSLRFNGKKFDKEFSQEDDWVSSVFFELIHECILELEDEIKIVNIPLSSQFNFDIVFVDDNEAAFELQKLIKYTLMRSDYPVIMEE